MEVGGRDDGKEERGETLSFPLLQDITSRSGGGRDDGKEERGETLCFPLLQDITSGSGGGGEMMGKRKEERLFASLFFRT